MPLDTSTANHTLNRLLEAWPVSKLRTMTVEQYADLADHNAFCSWLEYGSRDLGEIGGMPLTKFGLWKYKNPKEFSGTYAMDNTYAWNRKFGTTRTQAYNTIRNTIIDIVESAERAAWDRIESIEFHAIAKLKIAFVYSQRRLVPIYARENLLKVVTGLGNRFAEDAPIVELQTFIASRRPAGVDMIAYATDLSAHYVHGIPFRSYFIVGSKYKDDNGNDARDVFPEMLASSSIAIGFLNEVDLTPVVGASDEEINALIVKNAGQEITVSRLQSYYRILLKLKPGDIIAIKSHGSHGTLEIIAFAVVAEKNGKVYEYKPELLGHHIHVEFVELGIRRQPD